MSKLTNIQISRATDSKHIQINFAGMETLSADNVNGYPKLFRNFFDRIENFKFLRNLKLEFRGDLSEDEKLYLLRQTQSIEREILLSLGSHEDSLLGLRNSFYNLPTAIERTNWGELKVTKDFSAILMAAGPSIDENWNLLREVQNDYLLICVDAILKKALQNKVRPHIVVSTERGLEGLLFFENLPGDLKTILLGQITIPRQLFENYPGQKIWAGKLSGFSLWLPFTKNKLIWSGSSSAHLAYQACSLWGAKSIALVGQDLCYHPESFQSHADLGGIYEDWSRARKVEELVKESSATWVPGNTYEKVLTQPIWNTFEQEYILMMQGSHSPTFNASRLGRRIAGIPYQSLEAWIESQSDMKVEVSLESVDATLKAEKKDSLRQIAQQSRRALSAAGQRLESIDPGSENFMAMVDVIIFEDTFLKLVFELVIATYAELSIKEFQEVSSENMRLDFLNLVKKSISEVLQLLNQSDALGL
ncbi:MAG: hypothetical protein COV44_12075 [Deltaproteobacteria bacterium CG11_big_fil_rev_8_21_14_0_20_45_16]|nr:MAG: hypothetical protein COV44_12075 [Deltaproteobacteria bacterium CG11_big_fil_rev_8_21_14_0_20_45_16]